MEIIKYELRTHSRYIRDTLAPFVAFGGESQLSQSNLCLLRTILVRVDTIPMTLDLLRFSRIHKALVHIAAAGTGWPLEVVIQADDILMKWEITLGPLHDLRADLWGPGGRLEGLKKLKNWRDADEDRKSSWSVEGSHDPAMAYAVGDLGFAVGTWWIKPAAAFRDGIIDGKGQEITANECGAYAIILRYDEEYEIGEGGLIRYFTSNEEPGVFKLANTMASSVRGVIRVLRSWRLHSRLAPAGGLRYDGLYRVISYGTKLSETHDGKDCWSFTFDLRRESKQPSLQAALCHPTADELDDWKDYQRAKLSNIESAISLSSSSISEEMDFVRPTPAYVLESQADSKNGFANRKGSETLIESLSKML